MTRIGLLVALLLAITLHAFDDIAVATMLPAVARELDGEAIYTGGFLAYVLANLASLVAAGWCVDRYGVAAPFAVGVAVFGAGLLLGGNAWDMPVFIVARGMQGLGSGALQAVVGATVVLAWSGAARQRAISFIATAWVVPGLVGPLFAGFVTELWGWRWVFFGLLALAAATAAIGYPRLVRLRTGDHVQGSGAIARPVVHAAGESHTPVARGFVLDAIGVAVGAGLVLSGLGRMTPIGVALFVLGVVVIWKPLRAVMPTGFFTASTPLGASLAFRFLLGALYVGSEAWIPWALIRSATTTPVGAGALLASAALTWTAATWLVDAVIARTGARPLLIAAGGCLFAGLLHTRWMLDVQSLAGLVGAWGLCGFGIGLAYPTATMLAMSHAQPGHEGHLSTMIGMAEMLGIAVGIALAGAIVRAEEPDALLRVHWVWLVYAAVAAVLMMLPRRMQPPDSVQPEMVHGERQEGSEPK